MKDFETKIDNGSTSASKVPASDFNSIFGENENAVTPFFILDENDNQQLIKSMDIVSKALFYKDTGTANNIVLSRGATAQTIETLFDGLVVLFTPAHTNTGATTLQLKTLPAKPVKFNGDDLVDGFLKPGGIYISVYDKTSGYFKIETPIAGKGSDISGRQILTSGATYTAKAGDTLYVDTSTAKVTVTLPPAVLGDRIRIYDRGWSFDKNHCDVVSPDGTIINHITDGTPYEIDVRGCSRTIECIKNTANNLEWRTV